MTENSGGKVEMRSPQTITVGRVTWTRSAASGWWSADRYASYADFDGVFDRLAAAEQEIKALREDKALLDWAIEAGLIYNAGMVSSRAELVEDKAHSDRMEAEFAARKEGK